jgi:hypothetical protein
MRPEGIEGHLIPPRASVNPWDSSPSFRALQITLMCRSLLRAESAMGEASQPP